MSQAATSPLQPFHDNENLGHQQGHFSENFNNSHRESQGNFAHQQAEIFSEQPQYPPADPGSHKDERLRNVQQPEDSPLDGLGGREDLDFLDIVKLDNTDDIKIVLAFIKALEQASLDDPRT